MTTTTGIAVLFYFFFLILFFSNLTSSPWNASRVKQSNSFFSFSFFFLLSMVQATVGRLITVFIHQPIAFTIVKHPHRGTQRSPPSMLEALHFGWARGHNSATCNFTRGMWVMAHLEQPVKTSAPNPIAQGMGRYGTLHIGRRPLGSSQVMCETKGPEGRWWIH